MTASDDRSEPTPLRFQRCQRCGAAQTLERYACTKCGSTHLAWETSRGRGRIYALTEVARAPSDLYRSLVPYILALVDLDEGPRIMGHAYPGLSIGDLVECSSFRHCGLTLLKFGAA